MTDWREGKTDWGCGRDGGSEQEYWSLGGKLSGKSSKICVVMKIFDDGTSRNCEPEDEFSNSYYRYGHRVTSLL